MALQPDFSSAMANRSLRAIRSVGPPCTRRIDAVTFKANLSQELEFLTDAAVLTPQQYSAILSQLPSENDVRSLSQSSSAHLLQSQPAVAHAPPAPTSPARSSPGPYAPPTGQFANTSLNEKAPAHNSYSNYSSPLPPPAYAQSPAVISMATAMYAYTPTDAGDLALQTHDRIQVLEHMNNDWWRGRNERTGLEGIFPRSYVNVIDEKSRPPPSSYGNMPLEVSQGNPGPANVPAPEGRTQSKFEEQGKKFGKKLGNAAIFGAGATIGSNIVNSVF